jgi:hypothetical protein
MIKMLYNVENPETFNDVDHNVSSLTSKANILLLVVFIPSPVAVLICLSKTHNIVCSFP